VRFWRLLGGLQKRTARSCRRNLGGEQMLTYTDGGGHTIVIQAPGTPAWSTAEIVGFAEGVHVTGNAVAGIG
jgi:hypothetical protein